MTAIGNRNLIIVNPTFSYYFTTKAFIFASETVQVPTLSLASVAVAPSATVTVGPNAFAATASGGANAVITIQPGATEVTGMIGGINAQLTMQGIAAGEIRASFGPNFAGGTFTGDGMVSRTVRGGFTGTASANGAFITGIAENSGLVSIVGNDASCTASLSGALHPTSVTRRPLADKISATCIMSGDRARATAGVRLARVDLQGGSAGTVVALSSATISVSVCALGLGVSSTNAPRGHWSQHCHNQPDWVRQDR